MAAHLWHVKFLRSVGRVLTYVPDFTIIRAIKPLGAPIEAEMGYMSGPLEPEVDNPTVGKRRPDSIGSWRPFPACTCKVHAGFILETGTKAAKQLCESADFWGNAPTVHLRQGSPAAPEGKR